MEQSPQCPVCKNFSLELGERVDVGFGPSLGPKCGPDHCDICGYVEQGPDPTDYPIEHFIKCWNENINPWPPRPKMLHKPLLQKYIDWMSEHVKDDGYGKCRETCRAMVIAFPELRRVYGTYYCMIWGPRSHFWCIDTDNYIIDPTSEQFPSKGGGLYSLGRFYPIEIDMMNCSYL